ERASLGFDPSNLLSVRMALRGEQYASPEKVTLFYQSLLERVRGLPGVHGAVAANAVPFAGGPSVRFVIKGRSEAALGEEPLAANHVVTAGYFRLMKIQLLDGRGFDEKDSLGASRVAIVNENLLRRHFRGEEPVGSDLVIIGC